jgi:hypothetical protein
MTSSRKKGDLSLGLLTPEAARSFMRPRIESREWWTFLCANRYGADLLRELEKTHFAGRRSRDFELLLIPAFQEGLGVIVGAFAKKSRLKAAAVARIFDANGMAREAEEVVRGERDVFILAGNEELAVRLLVFIRQLLSDTK